MRALKRQAEPTLFIGGLRGAPAGNVRRMASTFYYIGSGTTTTQDYWYKYDSMNRFVTTMGAFSGSRGSGTIARGTTGLDITYDNAGQRTSATSTVSGATHLETYSYTEDGFLSTVKIQDGSGYNLTRAVDVRDAMGRVLTHTEYLANGSVSGGTETLGTAAYSRTATYDAAGNVTADTTARLQAKSGGGYDTFVSSTSYTMTGSVLTLATASNTVNGGSATTSTNAYDYELTAPPRLAASASRPAPPAERPPSPRSGAPACTKVNLRPRPEPSVLPHADGNDGAAAS